jgi:hypothetical protein
VVHGDDFTFSGMDGDLSWIEGLMKQWFEVKVRARLGPDVSDDKKIDVLGRVLEWTETGIKYQADPKHRSIILEKFGLGPESKGLKVPGRAEDPNEDDQELDSQESSEFRAIAARMNYLAQDCPDIQFATKEVCREMAKPTFGSWAKAKRVARYLLERETVVFEFKWQYEEPGLKVVTDSDWAGCRRTRRSTTGGVLLRGEHLLKTWSVTQGPIALSSAEAEYYAMVDGVLRAIGAQAMCSEIGVAGVGGPIELGTDSSAAKSFACRRGVGKARHVQARLLWLQQAVAERKVLVRKVQGSENPADFLTKYLGPDPVKGIAAQLNLRFGWRPIAEGSGRGGVTGKSRIPGPEDPVSS